ncbi:MAG TPA: OsmC family protein [Candidatus Nitrosotenuis sp.]|nr:OsmC family protein [Candidatus Nitrosotenuis sp.]
MIVNNVDLEKLSKTVESGKTDRKSLIKPVKLQGEWVLDPSKGYQFRTELSYEKGKQAIEVDSPSFLGGGGNRLGPMAYCIAGITSCFVGTFAGVAASQGVRLEKLGVSTQCNINFAKTLDVADEPIVNGIEFILDAKAENADRSKLEHILGMALERCPAMYSMSHNIPVSAKIS